VWNYKPDEYPPFPIPTAAFAIPRMCTVGAKENGLIRILLATFENYRTNGAPVGYAADPRTGHECGDSRYFAIPFLDACLAMRLPDRGSKDQTLKPADISKGWMAPLNGDTAMPATNFHGKLEESLWLPNEGVAKAWMEYVKTGAVSDFTPPPSPFNVKVVQNGDQGTAITWDATADFESGIGGFIVLRDGKEFAKVPENPIGKFGRPLFQSMTYHDTPDQPLPEALCGCNGQSRRKTYLRGDHCQQCGIEVNTVCCNTITEHYLGCCCQIGNLKICLHTHVETYICNTQSRKRS
jgi:hypothetical protein